MRLASSLRSRPPHRVLLALFVATVAGLNVWWRTIETRPPHWDMGHHLSNSLVYLHQFSLNEAFDFIASYRFYPPLVYWVADVFYAVLGNEAMWVAILSNVVWLGILVFSTYAIGNRLWNSRVGWLSVLFVVTAPMLVTSEKEFMLDLPITAISVLALYLLMRADGFSARRYSLLFGLVCGCGLLAKWTFPLVIALPVVHASAIALSQARLHRRFGPLLNLAGAAALVFAVAGTWYVHNFTKVAGALSYYSGPEGELRGNPRVATLDSALWYFWNLLNAQVYLLPFLFLLAGIAFCFRRPELAARNVYPILMLVGTYVTFTLLRHKDPRYTLPMLPAAAIVATSWLEYLSTRVRAWAAGAFAVYSVVAFLAISFGTSLLPKDVTVDVPSASFGPDDVRVFAQFGYIIGPPTDEQWHQEDSFKIIAKLPQPERTFDYEGPDTIWFNEHGVNYYRLRYGAKWVDRNQARFLIERGSPPAEPAGYTRLARWRLPDGGTVALLERL